MWYLCKSAVIWTCVPRNPSSGSINGLEQLTELRKFTYHLPVCYKGYDKRSRWTPTWKRCLRPGMWQRAEGFHACLNSPPSPQHVFPTLKACQTLGIFIEASSCRHDESVAYFPASVTFQEIRGGAEHSKLLILASACWWSAFNQESFRRPPGVTSIEQKKFSGGLEPCVRNRGQRPNIRTEDVPNGRIT